MSPATSWPKILFPLWDSWVPPVASRPGAVYTSPWSKKPKFDPWHQSLSHLLTRWVFLPLSMVFPATDGMEEIVVSCYYMLSRQALQRPMNSMLLLFWFSLSFLEIFIRQIVFSPTIVCIILEVEKNTVSLTRKYLMKSLFFRRGYLAISPQRYTWSKAHLDEANTIFD